MRLPTEVVGQALRRYPRKPFHPAFESAVVSVDVLDVEYARLDPSMLSKT